MLLLFDGPVESDAIELFGQSAVKKLVQQIHLALVPRFVVPAVNDAGQ
jgi:hypothetical protein